MERQTFTTGNQRTSAAARGGRPLGSEQGQGFSWGGRRPALLALSTRFAAGEAQSEVAPHVCRLAARELPSSGGLLARRNSRRGNRADGRRHRRPEGVEARARRRLVRDRGGARRRGRGIARVLRRGGPRR